jgi:glyoxalase family protein
VIHPILGLHHVTATVNDAQDDLDFCLGRLGLRLVKKTVNFDNHGVYHFYYGDERGTPGTIWTTFPYKNRGVRTGVKGAGQVVATSFSVPASSLGFWRARLAGAGAEPRDLETRFGEQAIRVDDPSGLWFELVASDRDTRAPWTGNGIAAAEAIRGLHSVTMMVRSPAPTLHLMTSVLGYEVVNEASHRTRVSVGGDRPGHTIDILTDPHADAAVNGVGTVHHVAMAISSGDEQRRLREELLQMGLIVTDIRDRCYFESIYFREPGGVLFEVATVQPGFTADEDLGSLGRELKLPPWEEPHRASIESALPAVQY